MGQELSTTYRAFLNMAYMNKSQNTRYNYGSKAGKQKGQ